jgi:phospholipase C
MEGNNVVSASDHYASLVVLLANHAIERGASLPEVQATLGLRCPLIIVTYDEGGGRWDHVPPPPGDRWGPGVRIPAVIISPYAKRGFVDHTTYETVSILKLIEVRWNVAPLGSRDAAANNLLNAFDFSQTP